jgi:hypothetical protein
MRLASNSGAQIQSGVDGEFAEERAISLREK